MARRRMHNNTNVADTVPMRHVENLGWAASGSAVSRPWTWRYQCLEERRDGFRRFMAIIQCSGMFSIDSKVSYEPSKFRQIVSGVYGQVKALRRGQHQAQGWLSHLRHGGH